ncbi:mCG20113, isoform CRA c [Amazona aestiva]|uniref:COP9 signalosome complex subunit 9 n=1 Tax=Amazona aestiva TaxID=12930 RepID=A0A0Q3PEU7_AMAAE|nr:mCG20113, isoform CRA c [Amazona aestiva]
MKPAVDEMFPEGAGPYVDLDEAGGSTGLLMDLAANEKAVHADFFNGHLPALAISFIELRFRFLLRKLTPLVRGVPE